MSDPGQLRREYQPVKLDRAVTYRERFDARGRGRNAITYRDHSVWAKRLDTEADFETDGLIRRTVQVRYLMRYDSRIKPLDLIVDGAATYVVDTVSEIGRRRWLEVLTRRETA